MKRKFIIFVILVLMFGLVGCNEKENTNRVQQIEALPISNQSSKKDEQKIAQSEIEVAQEPEQKEAQTEKDLCVSKNQGSYEERNGKTYFIIKELGVKFPVDKKLVEKQGLCYDFKITDSPKANYYTNNKKSSGVYFFTKHCEKGYLGKVSEKKEKCSGYIQSRIIKEFKNFFLYINGPQDACIIDFNDKKEPIYAEEEYENNILEFIKQVELI